MLAHAARQHVPQLIVDVNQTKTMRTPNPRRRASFAPIVVIGMALNAPALGAEPPVESAAGSAECTADGMLSHSSGRLFLPIEGRFLDGSSAAAAIPARHVKVFPGSFVDGAFQAAPRTIPIKAHASEGFHFIGTVWHSAYEYCRNGKAARTEFYGTAHYLIRAKHCDDLVLEISKDWKPHDVELPCGQNHTAREAG